jgi:hypothetical protein
VHNLITDFKNDFSVNKIAGLMMLHYFKWPWCLEDLQNYVDEIYLLLHYSPQFQASWPKDIPGVKGYIEFKVDEEWDVMEWRKNQEEFREKLLRMLDSVKPELVFFPDEDECFPEPEFIAKDLKRFYRSGKKQMAFKRCNFWDAMDMVRRDKWVTYYPHTKIYKWQPGLTYRPYLGFNRVTTFCKKRMVAKAAIKHYAYMEKKERERRYDELYKQKQKTFEGLLKKPRLVKYTNARVSPRT